MIRRLTFILAAVLLTSPVRASEADALAAALERLSARDWVGATISAASAGDVGGEVVEWVRLRAGQGTQAEYTDFLTRHSDWPGLQLLQQRGEAAVAQNPDPVAVVRYFETYAPRTGTGALALALAYRATGDSALADAEALRAWLGLQLTDAAQATFLAQFGPVLKDHHEARLDAMIWAGNQADARRMLPLVSDAWQTSAKARLGLLDGADGVDILVAAVPHALSNGAGLAYARFIWRFTNDRYDDAAALLLERSTSVQALGKPEAWAERRARLARLEMRQGDSQLAYKLATRHFLTPDRAPGDFADLEWLAGYIALQKLGDPATALTHFQTLRRVSKGEISLGRAGYWEGRAYEALGRPDDARAAYAFGAEHQTGFYGLLAAERGGLPMDPALAGDDSYPDWHGAAFMQSSVLQAALLLQKAGQRNQAKQFFLHLAEGLSPVELGQLADLALSLNEPNAALMIAKQAAERGTILNRAYYPLTELAKATLPVPNELALAIARRESEFDFSVVSSAGARGLMQVMPGTAKMVAPGIGLDYQPDWLTTDPGYNAKIGTAYLATLRGEFGASPLLVAAGYNAGPGRPRRWIQDLGDPRLAGVDPVDWIEAIPFTETRSYIMRVTESMMIYRARLAGGPVPIRLAEELKGQ